MPLTVNEIFYSIQGESTYAGLPCAFVRLSGCNLRCAYCDTTYAYSEGTSMDIPTILESLRRRSPYLVEVTGGEPLIQEHTPELIRSLIEKGYQALLETNGSLDIGGIDTRCTRILDIKCPSSGENDKIHWKNLDHLTQKDQVKFVIQTREDYQFAKSTLQALEYRVSFGHLLFSPVLAVLPARDLAEWILDDRLPVRLHLQLHKIVWPECQPGR